MGVVRREGDWRLEKHHDEVYSVTFDHRQKLIFVLQSYSAEQYRKNQRRVEVPVLEVVSYNEAEQVFQTVIEDEPRTAGEPSPEDEANLDEFPRGVLGGITLIGGLFFAIYSVTQGAMGLAVAGGGVSLVGVYFAIRTYSIYDEYGTGVAFRYLKDPVKDPFITPTELPEFQNTNQTNRSTTNTKSNNNSNTPTHSTTENTQSGSAKTPPAPKSLVDEIVFNRAEQHCEWCDDFTHSPEVHHIKPRSEGGPNTHRNLIALCPNCHRLADNGGISRSKLKSKTKRILDDYTPVNSH